MSRQRLGVVLVGVAMGGHMEFVRAADVAFGPQQVISTAANGARSLFAADVDGDGDIDVLSASTNVDKKIAWYENTDGEGTFGPQQVISADVTFFRSVFAADVDGDGNIDVLSASAGDDNNIAWYENTDGAGTFGPQQVISTANIGRSVFAVDVNGDGNIDVLAGLSAQAGDMIVWYENTDGGGTFGPQQVISTDVVDVWSVFAADVDGDGDIDVLSASWGDDKIAWYENMDGEGTFGPQQVISTAADSARSVFAADVDGDGDIDVLSASLRDDKIAWYENTDGAGTFGVQRVITTAADGARSVFAADVDGDGDIDVLSASERDGKIAWYENHKCEIAAGASPDCNGNSVPDACDIDAGFSLDCNGNGIPDDCDLADGAAADCNDNVIPDSCEVADGTADDCNANGVPDECEPDCNDNAQADECDIAQGLSRDCNGNAVPDKCDFANGTSGDCNLNGTPDECDLADGPSTDCNSNGTPDECDISGGFSPDCNGNAIPDECEPDCNANLVADDCDLRDGDSTDCNGTGVPDECELADGTSTDCNADGVPDECQPDCNANGIPDDCDVTAIAVESTDVPRPVPAVGSSGTTTATIDLPVSMLVRDLDVALDITHTFDRDLTATLSSPAGTEVLLFDHVGGSGDDFRDTILDDNAETSIADAAAPFTGTFRPMGTLADFNGENARGTWTLRIDDDQAGDSGTLNRWALLFPAASSDCDANGTPDECQPDTDGDGIIDACELPGDFDFDGDADLADYLILQACFSGPGVPRADGCDRCDIDDDNDIDLADLVIFQTFFTGAR